MSKVKFILENWNPITNRYKVMGEWKDEERAWIMFNKGYNRRCTRRLKKVTTEILKKSSAEKW